MPSRDCRSHSEVRQYTGHVAKADPVLGREGNRREATGAWTPEGRLSWGGGAGLAPEGKSGFSGWGRRAFQTKWTGAELSDHEKLTWPQPKEGPRDHSRMRQERLAEARRGPDLECQAETQSFERQRENLLCARHCS